VRSRAERGNEGIYFTLFRHWRHRRRASGRVRSRAERGNEGIYFTLFRHWRHRRRASGRVRSHTERGNEGIQRIMVRFTHPTKNHGLGAWERGHEFGGIERSAALALTSQSQCRAGTRWNREVMVLKFQSRLKGIKLRISNNTYPPSPPAPLPQAGEGSFVRVPKFVRVPIFVFSKRRSSSRSC
jgi:hypothetical protein